MTKKEIQTNTIKNSVNPKHLFVLKQISENVRNEVSIGEAMRNAGYSEAYSKNPNHFRETNAWQALMLMHISDQLLASVHHGLLIHKEWRARDAGLEKAYKLKKKYGDITVKHKFGELTDAELEAEIAGLVSEAIGFLQEETDVR